MKTFFKKLKAYGIRRAFVFVLLKFLQKIRCIWYRYLFSDNSPTLVNVKFNQPAQFLGKGNIKLNSVYVGVWPSPSFLDGCAYFEARNPTASIEIGEGTFLNNGAVIVADKGNITIGKRCLIGLRFSVVDSDFHGLEVVNRCNGNYDCADVIIGDDIFIGNNVTILKGVTIGDGAVIGGGSMVLKDVPAATVYAGVPAKFIKDI